MKPICIWYHGLFFLGDPPQSMPGAMWIVAEQMGLLWATGLLNAASSMYVGVNGGLESARLVKERIPSKAQVIFHGLGSRSENLTIVALHDWAKGHPDWNILYFHSKGASCEHGSEKFQRNAIWRQTMMNDLVLNWRTCVAELEAGHDIVCSHWKWHAADGSQHLPAGNFCWLTSNFVAKLPSIFERERIKISGIGAVESRYEAEVFWGNGPRPNVKMFRKYPGDGIP